MMDPATGQSAPQPQASPAAAPGADATIGQSVLHALVDAARLAPSPDNNQPWAFRLRDEGIDVVHVRRRAIRSDVRDLFSWLAIGAAIENLVLAASAEGLEACTELHPPAGANDDHELIARLSFAKGGPADPLSDRLASRVTNRKPYRKTPIAQPVRQRLSEAAERPGVSIHWEVDRARIRFIASLVQAADRLRFESPAFHEELFEVLRFDPGRAESTRDGLDVRTLEMPRPAWPFLRWLGRWSRMRLMNRLGASRMFAAMSARQVRASGALAWLATGEATDAGFIEAGRAMQRFWLAADAEGLALQPLGSVPLFLLKLEADPDSFMPRHRALMEHVHDRLMPWPSSAHPLTPVMLLRLGRAQPPSARSLRYERATVMVVD